MNDHPADARYYPPSHDVLVHFAQAVGQDLGGEYAEPVVVSGLADFMGVVARVLASDLNRKQGSG
jgi:hypothetical protein